MALQQGTETASSRDDMPRQSRARPGEYEDHGNKKHVNTGSEKSHQINSQHPCAAERCLEI